MIKLFFLLPILMCSIWWLYLNQKGYSAKDGLKGFAYILGLNGLLLGFLLVMMYITN
ncbi:hypothetical protein [Thalassotalea euphylliae]|uniref:hypothetical protein n=1 Tax=Thalassotalea euphylliae TaxID=1655234 RepID=UPI0015F27E5D|nr:hypothetical protein [Thalassotalea euphylliae]